MRAVAAFGGDDAHLMGAGFMHDATQHLQRPDVVEVLEHGFDELAVLGGGDALGVAAVPQRLLDDLSGAGGHVAAAVEHLGDRGQGIPGAFGDVGQLRGFGRRSVTTCGVGHMQPLLRYDVQRIREYRSPVYRNFRQHTKSAV